MTTRKQLIRAAATDQADEGVKWMKRLERWLEATTPVVLFPVTAYCGDFGTVKIIPSRFFQHRRRQ